jgi:hypothetical protein
MGIDITIRVKEDHYEMLKARSNKEQRSVAAIVRLILDEKIKQETAKKEKKNDRR